jgi:hypothetical protein
MVERIDPDRIVVLGGDESDAQSFIESDFKIRSGMCPNNCGLMVADQHGQNCLQCGFSCNTHAELRMQ